MRVELWVHRRPLHILLMIGQASMLLGTFVVSSALQLGTLTMKHSTFIISRVGIVQKNPAGVAQHWLRFTAQVLACRAVRTHSTHASQQRFACNRLARPPSKLCGGTRVCSRCITE